MTYKCILQISAFIAVCSWEKRALLVFCTEKYSTEKKISRWSYLKFRGGLRALAGVISTKRANLQAAAAGRRPQLSYKYYKQRPRGCR